MKTIDISGHRFFIPQKWNEFTDAHFRYIANLSAQKMNVNEMLAKIFLYVTGIKAGNGLFKDDKNVFVSICIGKEKYMVESEQFAYAVSLLEWMFRKRKTEKGDIIYELQCDRIQNPVPKLRCGKKTLFGPSDGLTNITWGEYVYASSNMHWYGKLHNTEFLVKALSVIYREEGEHTDSDCRIAFDSDNCEYREQILHRAPMHEVNSIYLWFQACQTYIRNKYPSIYEGATQEQNDNPFDNYIRMTTAMAQHNAPSITDWMKTELYVVLASLDEQIKNSKQKPK